MSRDRGGRWAPTSRGGGAEIFEKEAKVGREEGATIELVMDGACSKSSMRQQSLFAME